MFCIIEPVVGTDFFASAQTACPPRAHTRSKISCFFPLFMKDGERCRVVFQILLLMRPHWLFNCRCRVKWKPVLVAAVHLQEALLWKKKSKAGQWNVKRCVRIGMKKMKVDILGGFFFLIKIRRYMSRFFCGWEKKLDKTFHVMNGKNFFFLKTFCHGHDLFMYEWTIWRSDMTLFSHGRFFFSGAFCIPKEFWTRCAFSFGFLWFSLAVQKEHLPQGGRWGAARDIEIAKQTSLCQRCRYKNVIQ